MSESLTLWSLPVTTWWWQVTLWTVGVFVLVRLLEGRLARVVSARGRMALYGLVALRLVLPPDWSAPVGVVGHSRLVAAGPPAAASVAAPTGAAAVQIPWLSRHATDAPSPAPASPSSPWPWVYLAGVAVLLGVFASRRRALRRIVAEAEPVSAAIAAWAPEARIVVHRTAGPLATGWRAPTIVLPQDLVARGDDDDTLACVVAHERAHVRGGDVALLHALTIATALAWPIAGVWLATRRVRLLLEEAADAQATVSLGIAPRRFARVLLRLVPTTGRPRTVGVGLGTYGQLHGRLVALARPVATSRLAQAGWVVSAGAIVAACAGVQSSDDRTDVRTVDCDTRLKVATTAHDTAANGGDPAAFVPVLEAYDAFLDACPAHADYGLAAYYAGEAQWAYATGLHDAGDITRSRVQFDEATARFDEAIEAGVTMVEDAAYGQLLATKHATGWTPRDPQWKCESSPCVEWPLVPYDDADARVLAAWDRYVQVVGRPVEASADEQLAMAKLRMQHNDFDRARPDLKELTLRAAGTEAGLRAAEMLTDVLTIAWVAPGLSADERRRRGDELDDWLGKIADSDTYAMEGAQRLRDGITALRGGVAHEREQLK